jgi:transcriptional regulator with XRE-family HTH domain
VPRKREKPALRAFGARLQHLRGERSRQTISNALRMKGVSLDESTLVGYEQGRVWSVDVGVMRGLSQVFGVTFDELAALLLANRRNPSATDWNDLLRHSDEYQSSASIKEGADVRASVEKERKRYRQYLETLQTAAQATLDDVKERLAELDAEESQSRRKRG